MTNGVPPSSRQNYYHHYLFSLWDVRSRLTYRCRRLKYVTSQQNAQSKVLSELLEVQEDTYVKSMTAATTAETTTALRCSNAEVLTGRTLVGTD